MSNSIPNLIPQYLLFVWLILYPGLLYPQPIPPTKFAHHTLFEYGGLIRGDTTTKTIFLTFTGGDYNEGTPYIRRILRQKKVLAQFFFTGDFYRLKENRKTIGKLRRDGHYLGPHSDKHLLYATWENRDSLLVSRQQFVSDLMANYQAMQPFKINMQESFLFMPPYEWYNQQISDWTSELGLLLINFTPGTRSNADYTTPDMGRKYLTSDLIFNSIMKNEEQDDTGLNGHILLLHVGTHPDRTDKFYHRLPELIDRLQTLGYKFDLLTHYIEKPKAAVESPF